MASQITVNGFAGAGVTVTALVLTNVTKFTIEPEKGILEVTSGDGAIQQYDISNATTMTVSISGANYTVAIS